MPVYIAVEVSRRELEARLLLGLVAAERGHDVVLGKIPHKALLGGRLNEWDLPPGVLHLKSAASSERIYERLDVLRQRGWRVTVQDEEHGLSGNSDYADFGRVRFPPEALERMDGVMTWGAIDHAWLEDEYPERVGALRMTGSPRVDLWRRDLIDAAPPAELRDHILVVSSMSSFGVNPLWVVLREARNGVFGPPFVGGDDPSEFEMYDNYADGYRFTKHLVRLVRRIASDHPDRQIVLRPHHWEPREAWEAALGPVPNVAVRHEGPARSWVRDAAVVVHGASTVGIEASVAGRHVVSFVPDGIGSDAPANRFGTRAESVASAAAAVDAVLEGRLPANGSLTEPAERFAALSGRLAADRIVDAWEEMHAPVLSSTVRRVPTRHPMTGRFGALIRSRTSTDHKDRFGESGQGVGGRMEIGHKFPSLDLDEVRHGARRIAEHLRRFDTVEITGIGHREVLLRRTD